MNFERDNIRRMAGYAYGEQPKDAGVVKLNTNENAYAPSPQVGKALARFDAETLRALSASHRRSAAPAHR